MSHSRCGKCHGTEYPLVDPSTCSACAWDVAAAHGCAAAIGGAFYFICLGLAVVGYLAHIAITAWAH